MSWVEPMPGKTWIRPKFSVPTICQRNAQVLKLTSEQSKLVEVMNLLLHFSNVSSALIIGTRTEYIC